MSSQPSELKYERKTDNQRLNERLETIGWALFLIMIGGIGLVPAEQVPEGTWLIGVGLIMLGLNAARYLNGLKVSGFTIALGILGVVSGFATFQGVDLPVFPIALILIGASLLLKVLFETEQA